MTVSTSRSLTWRFSILQESSFGSFLECMERSATIEEIEGVISTPQWWTSDNDNGPGATFNGSHIDFHSMSRWKVCVTDRCIWLNCDFLIWMDIPGCSSRCTAPLGTSPHLSITPWESLTEKKEIHWEITRQLTFEVRCRLQASSNAGYKRFPTNKVTCVHMEYRSSTLNRQIVVHWPVIWRINSVVLLRYVVSGKLSLPRWPPGQQRVLKSYHKSQFLLGTSNWVKLLLYYVLCNKYM